VIDVIGGGTLALPRDLAWSYAVILFYRGSWCPYCCAQLPPLHGFNAGRLLFAKTVVLFEELPNTRAGASPYGLG
jgi:hypothetical protein